MKYPVSEAVIQLQHGDTDSFSKIYELTHHSFYYIILKLVDSPEDAEDVLQDTYIQIFKNVGKLNSPEAFIDWSIKIAYNSAFAHIRKKKDVLLDDDEQDIELLQECNDEFLPSAVVESETNRQIILNIIDQLPVQQRIVILLYYYQEMKIPEIAKVLDCSEGTVKSRLNYARNTIRKAVGDEEKRSGKLYAIPFLLFGMDADKLAMSPGKSTALLERIATGSGVASAAPSAGVKPSSSGGMSAGAKTSGGVAGKFAALSAGKKIISGIIAVALMIGVPSVVYLSKNGQSTKPRNASESKEASTLLSNTATQGVDAEILGAYLKLTIRPPKDTSHITGYSLDLLDTAHPENNINRQCDIKGEAYISFEAAGTYDHISVTTLLDKGNKGGVWEEDVDVTSAVSSMPSYVAQYSTAENLVIAELSGSGATFIQFDISEQNGGSYTSLRDDSRGYGEYNSSNIVYCGFSDGEESLLEKVKTGGMYLRLRGWNYQMTQSDSDGILLMAVTYYDFGPYVPVPVGDRTID